MKLRPVPAPTLTVCTTLLAPYTDGTLTETRLIGALESFNAEPDTPSVAAMLAPRDAGRQLGVSRFTIRRMLKAGKLRGARVNGQWRACGDHVAGLARGEV